MTNIQTPRNRTLALAGVMQATFLCKNLANYGRCDAEQLSTILQSILKIDADSVTAVYGHTSNLRKGLDVLGSQLTMSGSGRDLDISRYSAALIQLSDNLVADETSMNQLKLSISQAQTLDFQILDPTLIEKFASIYRNCVSHLSPRIMISGTPEYLNNDLIAAKIRATLLGGIRSVVLWRQCGGTKPGLLFGRANYVNQARQLREA